MKADGTKLLGDFQKLVYESLWVTTMKLGVIRLKHSLPRRALRVLTVCGLLQSLDFPDFVGSSVLQCACEHNYFFASVHKMVFLFHCIFTLS